ncbi:MAG: hypothetical protein LBN26_04010 [Christensenellaceae bacterium]|jgi:hypothetical protein|nr:hypothetical protein [Christensenellaceae bacterium]
MSKASFTMSFGAQMPASYAGVSFPGTHGFVGVSVGIAVAVSILIYGLSGIILQVRQRIIPLCLLAPKKASCPMRAVA